MKPAMTVTTCEDQEQCRAVLDTLQITEVLRPIPPKLVTDGICQLSPECWIIGTNDRGIYTLHLLENASKEEAWKFFDSLHAGSKFTNQRIHFCGSRGADCARGN